MNFSSLLISLSLLVFSPAQDVLLQNISAAMNAGSAKELIKFCGDNVEIKINGKSSNYSVAQAEVVLKDFFIKNPVKKFTYIHQGSSPEGLKYTIGSLEVADSGYRVVMVIKKQKGVLKIDQIDFKRD